MTTPSPDADATVRVDADATALRALPRPSRADAQQLAPGAIIANRYRIASLLGKGGMGEVYRADDTKLDQPVALKFLPAALARDAVLLARLHDEVRLGRQVAHPNVCRIYDIGEWQGGHFIAMEYVDGEDLARLLQRIGRLAHDKAVEISRGIAAGLAAAHAKGILHRDLKPANILIDSRGDARISDFGLALTAEEAQLEGLTVGTPAYMAPEQLAGKAATVQSDLFSLGLVLYEIFTGKRAYSGRTLPELLDSHTSEVRTPSSIVREIEPQVERIILRCLSVDPEQRPRSAREVYDALPGGDPLLAALAAGETPSPRAVAAANVEGSLAPATAWMLTAVVILCVAAVFFVNSRVNIVALVPHPKAPEVLRDNARELLERIGVPPQPHEAFNVDEQRRYIASVAYGRRSPAVLRRFAKGPAALAFFLRQSPQTLTPQGDGDDEGAATPDNPPLDDGMATIHVDTFGRLIALEAKPEHPAAGRYDWSRLATAAGFDLAKMTPVAPSLVPPAFADQRAAWRGVHPDDGTPVRIEAAADGNVPVFFRITGAWDEHAPPHATFGGALLYTSIYAIGLTLVGIALFLAWRNLRLRRGDVVGARRTAIGFAVIVTLDAFCRADHHLDVTHELITLRRAVGGALLFALLVYFLYIAIEPYVRRRWPHLLISWTRLISGDWRNPIVGRDVLIGAAVGGAHAALAASGHWLPAFYGGRTSVLVRHNEYLVSIGPQLSLPASAINTAFLQAALLLVLLVASAMIFRKRAVAIAAVYVLHSALLVIATRADPYSMPFTLLIAAVLTFVVVRFGLLASTATQVTFILLFVPPLIASSDWTGQASLLPLALLAVMIVWAFRTALGGRSPWHARLLED